MAEQQDNSVTSPLEGDYSIDQHYHKALSTITKYLRLRLYSAHNSRIGH